MRRKPSAPSLKSDSGPEDFLDFHHHHHHHTTTDNEDDNGEDTQSSIFMADPTESGNTSDQEKDDSTATPYEYGLEDGEMEVTEGTSLLAVPSARRAMYGGVALLKQEEAWKEESVWNDRGGGGGGGAGAGGGQSVPTVIYASPARPHLPSPSASNPRLSSGKYHSNAWRFKG